MARGEITPFLILGVVLILSVSILLYAQHLVWSTRVTLGTQEYYSLREGALRVADFYGLCFATAGAQGALPRAISRDYPLGDKLSSDIATQARTCLGRLRDFELSGFSIRYGHLTYARTSEDPLGLAFQFPLGARSPVGVLHLQGYEQTYPYRVAALEEFYRQLYDAIHANPLNIPYAVRHDGIHIVQAVAQTRIGVDITQIVTYRIVDDQTGESIILPVVHSTMHHV